MMEQQDNIAWILRAVNFVVIFFLLAFGYLVIGDVVAGWFKQPLNMEQVTNTKKKTNKAAEYDKIVGGIHIQTGLVYAEGFDIVRGTCTACHSAKLVTQNRATREGWKQMITWMQATQGLWDLGKNEPIILDYLSKHYAPKAVGRRANIDIEAVEWYILELNE